MTVNDTDKFLVNRSNTSFHLEAQNMAELQDTDLMLVNRGGVSYKATGAEIKDSLGPKGVPNKPSIIAPADGAGMEISAESDEIVGAGITPVSTWDGMNQVWTGSGSTLSPNGTTTGVIPEQLPKTGLVFWEVKLTTYQEIRQLGIYFSNTPSSGYEDNTSTLYFNGASGTCVLLTKNSDGSSTAGPGGKHGGATVQISDESTHYAGVDFKVGDLIGFAFNADLGAMWVSRNGEYLLEKTKLQSLLSQSEPELEPNPFTGYLALWSGIDTTQDLYFGSGGSSNFQVENQTSSTYAPTSTVLTLAGNKNLSGDSSFVAGDAVEQDSGHTPTTSAITSVIDKSYDIFPDGYVDNMMGLYLNQSVQKGLVLAKLLDASDVANAPATHGIGTVTIGGPGTPWAIGDVLNVALDPLNGRIWYGINGTWLNSGNPPNGTGMVIQAPANSPMYFQLATQLPISRGCSFGINRVAENTIPAGFALFTGSWLNGGEASAIDAPDSTGIWPGVKTYAEFKYLSEADGVSGPGGANLICLGFTNGPAIGGTFVLKELNLQDDTDLENFRVGDVVQGVNEANWDNLFRTVPTGSGPNAIWQEGTELASFQSGDTLPLSTDAVLLIDTELLGSYKLTFTKSGVGDFRILTNDSPSTPVTNEELTASDAGPIVISNQGGSSYPYKRYITVYGTNASSLGATVTGTIAFSSYKATAINEATPSITVDGGTWTPGEVVTGPYTTPATGTVASTDPVANTITLATSDEASPKRWIVNQGKFVKGPPSPSKDAAPDVAGLELFSSAFTSTPANSLGQTGASWQVAAYDDINFATPVAQEIESTTDLTQWPVVPELAADTQYRCRVQHISSDQKSEWSDASTFKTADDDSDDLIVKPGDVWVSSGTYSTAEYVNNPVKMTSVSWGNYAFALGVDGILYKAPTTSYQDFSPLLTPSSDVIGFGNSYSTNCLYLDVDGKVTFFNGDAGAITGNKVELALGVKAVKFGFVPSGGMPYLLGDNGDIYEANAATDPSGVNLTSGLSSFNFKTFAMGAHSATKSERFYGINQDGHLYQSARNTGINTPGSTFSGVTHINTDKTYKRVISGFDGTIAAVTTDNKLEFLEKFDDTLASALPSDIKIKEVGCGYYSRLVLTKDGRVFVTMEPAYTPYPGPWVSGNAPTLTTWEELDLPKPCAGFTTAKYNGSGYDCALILSD